MAKVCPSVCEPGATPDLGAWIEPLSISLAHSVCAARPPTVARDHGQDCHTVHDPGCYARTYDRATGGWTRCNLPAGHDGDHSDGCLQWTTLADFWATVAASG